MHIINLGIANFVTNHDKKQVRLWGDLHPLLVILASSRQCLAGIDCCSCILPLDERPRADGDIDTLAKVYEMTVRRIGTTDATVAHHCTASISVALFLNHEGSEEDILKWADAAMYAAKAGGRNAVRFHKA